MWVSGQSQSLTETTVLWLSLAQKLEKCRSLSLCCYPVATFFCQSSANCCSSSWNWFILLKQLVAIRARGFAGEQTRFPNKIALQLVFWLPTLSAEESVIRVFHLFRISLSAKCSQQRCSLCFLLHQHSKTHTQKERHLIKKKWKRGTVLMVHQNLHKQLLGKAGVGLLLLLCTDVSRRLVVTCDVLFLLPVPQCYENKDTGTETGMLRLESREENSSEQTCAAGIPGKCVYSADVCKHKLLPKACIWRNNCRSYCITFGCSVFSHPVCTNYQKLANEFVNCRANKLGLSFILFQ